MSVLLPTIRGITEGNTIICPPPTSYSLRIGTLSVCYLYCLYSLAPGIMTDWRRTVLGTWLRGTVGGGEGRGDSLMAQASMCIYHSAGIFPLYINHCQSTLNVFLSNYRKTG